MIDDAEAGASNYEEAMEMAGYGGRDYDELDPEEKEEVDRYLELGQVLNGGTRELEEMGSSLD